MNNLSLIDSPFFGSSLTDARMREIFCARAFLRRCVETEVALARAQARLGVIPADAAHDIAQVAESYSFDEERLARETEIVGYPILPIVEQLADAAGKAGVSALGRDHAGHHGHGGRVAGTGRTGPDRNPIERSHGRVARFG
jgi:3-carboxy-cis,cis-muconate cycloisomerase